MLQKCGIKPEDEKHIPLYKDYAKMLADGEKSTYIQLRLSEKYGICPRQVYSIYKRLNERISIEP